MSSTAGERYGFGANWESFIAKHYSEERRKSAAENLLGFLGRQDLDGLAFLDIGSGSGLHSLAAFDAGAVRIHSFDYDALSVRTTGELHRRAGAPASWHVERGDVLDGAYMDALGTWDVVYAWGVLHHTGDMWRAIDNAARRVAPGGLFFLALYSSNVAAPSPEFWLDVKRRYNAAGALGKRRLELWYLWHFGLGRNPLRLPLLARQMRDRRRLRGMSYMTDVRDWLGGWPMEYADDQEVVDTLEEKHGHRLVNVLTGEACTQFLFRNEGIAGRKTSVVALAEARRGQGRP
jgi:2-polyprenyl-6-hydroxyphenyl methylase/3-demethylubiquinone-9 3-methyltransferase